LAKNSWRCGETIQFSLLCYKFVSGCFSPELFPLAEYLQIFL